MVNSSIFHYICQLRLITYKSYSKFCTRKCEKQYYMYCNYNDILVVYINASIALMSVRNHYMMIYNNSNKGLDNRPRLAHHPTAYKVPC